MTYTDHYLRELCLEVALGNVEGERFNDLLLKTGVLLEDFEWTIASRLLEEAEQQDHLARLTTVSLN